jgi:serine/threonine protein kinase
MTKMNGGFLLNDTHESKTIEDAIEFFKKNSTFSILTNSSRACITFKAVLKASIDSPFIQIRSGIIEQPVTTLLFKYFPINTLNTLDPTIPIMFDTHDRRGKIFPYIQLAEKLDIQKEYDIQLQVYQTTYNTISSAYEPVCPYPIHCFTDLDKNKTIQEIINRLDKTNKEETENKLIITEITDTLGGTIDSLIKDNDKASINYNPIDANAYIKINGTEARALITTLGCIVMEFMDGYTILSDYLDRIESEYKDYKEKLVKELKKAKSLAAYELVRLKQIGFIHGDLHNGNIMYNPNYKYITNDDEDVEHTGRALIIDFGDSLIDKNTLVEFENDNLGERDLGIFVWDYKVSLKFFDPYTFEEIYRRRLEVTLTFREKMIQGLEQMLTEFKKLTTKKQKTKFIQENKIQLKLGLITNLKWPTNFVNPNVGDFEKEEFDTPFIEVQSPIFEESNEKIQRLTQKRDKIIPKVQALIELKEPELPQAELPQAELPQAELPQAELPQAELPAETTLESKATKAFNWLEHLTNKFTILFPPTPSVHGGSRYIHSHKTQNAFSNRLKHRTRTTLRIKRRKQTKRRKRGKRSKKGKRSKRKQ